MLLGHSVIKVRQNGLLLAFALTLTATAHAGLVTVYNNPYNSTINDGACDFNTVCEADDFGAQEFSLASATTVTAASFTDLDEGAGPTSVNYMILLANGTGGLPGTMIASGSASLSETVIGSDGCCTPIDQWLFALTTPLALSGSTNYYLAVQAVTTNRDNYLAVGTATSGASETFNGGSTWVGPNFYNGFTSVTVALYSGSSSAVPEPGSLGLLVLGLAAFAGIRRYSRS